MTIPVSLTIVVPYPGVGPLRDAIRAPVHYVMRPSRTQLFSFSDNVGGRTLSAASFASSTLTTETCIAFCSSNNYIYAGTEYAVRTIIQPLHTHALISFCADIDRMNAVSASWLLLF